MKARKKVERKIFCPFWKLVFAFWHSDFRKIDFSEVKSGKKIQKDNKNSKELTKKYIKIGNIFPKKQFFGDFSGIFREFFGKERKRIWEQKTLKTDAQKEN